MSHVYQTVFDDVGALIVHLAADAVVQLTDDWHQLRNCLVKEVDWPLLKSLCKDGVVGVSTNLGYNLDCLIHKDSALLKETNQLRNYH